MSGEKNEGKAKTEEKLGKDAFKRKEFDMAMNHYKEAIRLNPREVAYRHHIAKLKFEQKKYGECIKYCRRTVKVGKENKGDVKVVAKAYILRGRARIEIGEPDRGKADIEKAVTFFYKIANVKYENHKIRECLKFCDRAINISNEDVIDFDLINSVLLLKLEAMATVNCQLLNCVLYNTGWQLAYLSTRLHMQGC